MRTRHTTACALLAGLACVSFAQLARAVPVITLMTDAGTITATTYNPATTASTTVPSPYGVTNITITKYPTFSSGISGYWVTFYPNSDFYASANNLGGGKTSLLSAHLAFDIAFDSPVNLTMNLFEDGLRTASGNGKSAAKAADLAGGMAISQLDNPLTTETISNSFASQALYFTGTGTWSLYDTLHGFSKTYTKYHVVIDNNLIAESLANASQGFAGIATKNVSILFTFDGSNGSAPRVPEPATLGTLLAASAAFLTQRGRQRALKHREEREIS